MNWKRGLGRLYAVLWIGFAIVGAAYVSIPASRDIAQLRTDVREYLTKNPTITVEALRSGRAADSLRALSSRPEPGHLYGPGEKEANDALLAAAKMRSDEYRNPLKHHAMAWGFWAVFCVVIPALLLAILTWIASGFSRERNLPT